MTHKGNFAVIKHSHCFSDISFERHKMADPDTLIKAKIHYYGREKYYRQMQIAAVEGMKRFSGDPGGFSERSTVNKKREWDQRKN